MSKHITETTTTTRARWKPKEGEVYWYVENKTGGIWRACYFEHCEYDRRRDEQGNVHKTLREAFEYAERNGL